MFISRAPNFEDVRLHQAFPAGTCGRYVDIGQSSDHSMSISEMCYRNDWQGFAVCQSPASVSERQHKRSRERVLDIRDFSASLFTSDIDWVRIGYIAPLSVVSVIESLPKIGILLLEADSSEIDDAVLGGLRSRNLSPVLYDGATHFFANKQMPYLASGLARPVNEGRRALLPTALTTSARATRVTDSNNKQIVEELRDQLSHVEAELASWKQKSPAYRYGPIRIWRAVQRRIRRRLPASTRVDTALERAAVMEVLGLAQTDAVDAWTQLLSPLDEGE